MIVAGIKEFENQTFCLKNIIKRKLYENRQKEIINILSWAFLLPNIFF